MDRFKAWWQGLGRPGRIGVVAAFVLVLLVGIGLAADDPEEVATTATTTTAPPTTLPPTTTTTLPPLPPGDDTTVTRVIDGDTIEVAGGTRVRFIGIDTPETQTCFAAEATERVGQLLPAGQRVRLVYDVERLDRFGRTLAYVYRLPDGVFVNLALARDGFAQQLTVPPNVARAEEFRAAVAEARSANRGLWAACPVTTTTQAPPPTRAPATTRPPATSPPATDAPSGGGGTYFANCAAARAAGAAPLYRGDPGYRAGLDRDNDGVACE